jgi:hypothetical protein
MPIKESTFTKSDLVEFLYNEGATFAATCFTREITEPQPTSLQVSNWFKKYFADSNRAQYLFRLAECKCTQEAAYSI